MMVATGKFSDDEVTKFSLLRSERRQISADSKDRSNLFEVRVVLTWSGRTRCRKVLQRVVWDGIS